MSICSLYGCNITVAILCSCPYVQRAKIVLKEKNIPYDTIYVDKANKSKEFLDLFRHITSNHTHRGTVPVIVGEF